MKRSTAMLALSSMLVLVACGQKPDSSNASKVVEGKLISSPKLDESGLAKVVEGTLESGSKLNGTYALINMDGTVQISHTFSSNGKVITDSVGAKMEQNYVLDGKTVKYITPQGTLLWTLIDDKTIEGPGGQKYVKLQ